MGKFFHRWRRKTGVVTLVLACAFTAGWIRSRERFDVLRILTGSTSSEAVRSYKGRLYWFSYFECDPDFFEGMSGGWKSEYEPDDGHFDDWIVSVTGVTWSTFWGFAFAHHEFERMDYKISVRSAPYQYFVIPLSLLSAYLLLVKPRFPKPKPDFLT